MVLQEHKAILVILSNREFCFLLFIMKLLFFFEKSFKRIKNKYLCDLKVTKKFDVFILLVNEFGNRISILRETMNKFHNI